MEKIQGNNVYFPIILLSVKLNVFMDLLDTYFLHCKLYKSTILLYSEIASGFIPNFSIYYKV